MRETLEKIRESFGSQVVRSDGSLDRKKLADIVFSDSHHHAMFL